ncbi:MAG TPA: hypothetical protein VH764_00445 [Gemmatimonadales bacterium]|jgi:hypothetical protein
MSLTILEALLVGLALTLDRRVDRRRAETALIRYRLQWIRREMQLVGDRR